VAITQRYGEIGIAAVAAAARYQGKKDKNSAAASRSPGKGTELTEGSKKESASPRRR
jgi:hypothetical protein